MRPIAPLLLLAPFAVGCEELDPYLPKVSFQRLEVEDISFEEVDSNFVFSVDNPNPIDIDLASFSYALELEAIELLAGDNEDGFELEAVGSSELSLPVQLTWQSAWDTVQATRGQDYVDFGLAGHFGFDTMTDFGEARVRYDEQGDFPALRTPTFRFKKVRVTGFDFTSADLAIDLGIDNPHGSTLFFDAFDYQLSLDGKPVADGLVDQLGDIEGATEGTVTLPITVDLITAGTQLFNAIVRGDRMPVHLDATMDVDTPFGIVPFDVDEAAEMLLESQ